jgi:multidrug efflux system membrane fusion protein
MKLFSTVEREGPPSSGPALCTAVEVGLLLFLLEWLGGCSPRKAESQDARIMAVPVIVASVTLKTVPVELHAIGNGEAYSTINVKSQVDGQLEHVYFTEGQDVKKGDLIFKIDTRPFEAALHQAEANLARDLAQEKNAQAQADRGKKLFDEGITSKEQFDQLAANAAALAATVRADRAAVENAKIQLDYCSIYSPLDGRTGTLMVHPGNIVKANDMALVVINQISPLYVDFTVPEKYLPDIKRYLARGNLRVDASVPNDQGPAEEGTISFVNNTVDSSTGTILLKATFPNARKRLWPGQFMNVVVTLTSVHDAVVVPNQAVQTGQAGQYVFVLKDDHSVEIRPVVPGSVWGADEVIEKGLRAGETVVTDGQLLLYPGARVEVKSAASGIPSLAPGSDEK